MIPAAHLNLDVYPGPNERNPTVSSDVDRGGTIFPDIYPRITMFTTETEMLIRPCLSCYLVDLDLSDTDITRIEDRINHDIRYSQLCRDIREKK